MKQFGIQMIDNSISSQWWKTIMKYFVKIGNSFEIRCWKEEAAEIESASLYGVAVDDKCEVSIKGSVTKELLEKLLIEEPTDKSIYNKMTKYFTIHVENDLSFDVTPDAFEAIETLIDLGCDRVLTSGQKSKAMEGIDLIKVLNNQYGEKIQILPGSGMNAENAKMMMNYTGVYQVHSSCKNYKADTTTTKNGVSYSYLASPHENDYDVVDVELVKKLVDSIK